MKALKVPIKVIQEANRPERGGPKGPSQTKAPDRAGEKCRQEWMSLP